MPEKCHVHNCTAQAVSHGLCDKHRKRLARHGTIEQTRPGDWGLREKHPLYKTWCGLIRYHKFSIPDDWKDFWSFAKQIPLKPSDKARIFRPDPQKPWGLNNFYWKESSLTAEQKTDRATYMRHWQRQKRAANKNYNLNSNLKKTYGITLEWFNDILESQNGKCAICKKEETLKIKGKVVRLAVDHCHETNKIRGLLCSNCNRGLGLFCDDPNLIRKAAAYIESHKEGSS